MLPPTITVNALQDGMDSPSSGAKDSMILVRLIGGLGNQMFQYEAGRALAARLDAPLLLDLRDFRRYRLRSYGLDRMQIQARPATAWELARWPIWLRNRRWPVERFGLASRWFREDRMRFSPAFANLTGTVGLDGYFQSELYFADVRQTLLHEFRPRAPLSRENNVLAETIRAVAGASLHVRRGDYVSDPKTSAVHGVCSPAYYQRAISLLRERYEDLRVFVFSDDPAWCRANLSLDGATFVEGNGAAPECDIFLMAQCRHHIIANSSFSWWGAWLADQPGTTIAPRPWFSDGTLRDDDLIPSAWLRLPRD